MISLLILIIFICRMKVAIGYRGHYVREIVRDKKRRFKTHQINFFENLENHQKMLLNSFDNIEVFLHTYAVDDETDMKLIKSLSPTKYIIDKKTSKYVNKSMKCVNELIDPKQFDFIINLRFDIVFKKKFTSDYLVPNKFNFLFKDLERFWKRQKRASDLLYSFDSKFHSNFQCGLVNKKSLFANKIPHMLFRGMVDCGCSSSDLGFLVEGFHSSWVSETKSTNELVTLNRGYGIEY